MTPPRTVPFAEAVRAAMTDPHIWIRPVSWKEGGVQSALIWDPQRGWLAVPSSRGGHPAPMPAADDLLGEWVAETADEVLGNGRTP